MSTDNTLDAPGPDLEALRAELAVQQARADREHQRRCALETLLQRLALSVGQDAIDKARLEAEQRHGPIGMAPDMPER
jgi:hypothetical protein